MVGGEICCHVIGYLIGNQFGRDDAVNRRMFAVNGLPIEVEIKVDVGTIGQFHINFVAFKFDSLDAYLREISANESVDFRIVGVVSASVSASTVSAAADDVEVGVKLDF